MSYNLDDVEEYFDFQLNSHQYRMRYPTTREVLEAKDIKDKTEDDQLAFFFGFVEPLDGAPPIAEALQSSSVKKTARFTQMIIKQFNEDGENVSGQDSNTSPASAA